MQKELTLEYILGDGMLIWVLPAKTAYVVNIEQGCVVTGVGQVILSCLTEVGNSAEESQLLMVPELPPGFYLQLPWKGGSLTLILGEIFKQ